MLFAKPLERWRYTRREKRFFIYGTEAGQTAHCPNTGSLKSVLEHATHVWVTDHGPKAMRSLRYTAELAELPDGTLVIINTAHANALAAEAMLTGRVPGWHQVSNLTREVRFSTDTRFDLRFSTPDFPEVWAEVKNVTLAEESYALFPDARTERGTKHLHRLQQIAERGGTALQLYVVVRTDVTRFRPAETIDPVYASALRTAVAAGVQVAALGCRINPQGAEVCQTLPVVL
jgi:sugar fermentation stimulation protein A